jgi:hypothetical protein
MLLGPRASFGGYRLDPLHVIVTLYTTKEKGDNMMRSRDLAALTAAMVMLPLPAMAGAGGWFVPVGAGAIIILAIIIYLVWRRRGRT